MWSLNLHRPIEQRTELLPGDRNHTVAPFRPLPHRERIDNLNRYLNPWTITARERQEPVQRLW
jgi:hypothetical protein